MIMSEKHPAVKLRALTINRDIPVDLLVETVDAGHHATPQTREIETIIEPQQDPPVVIPVTLLETPLVTPPETVHIETENLVLTVHLRSHLGSRSHIQNQQRESLLIHCPDSNLNRKTNWDLI